MSQFCLLFWLKYLPIDTTPRSALVLKRESFKSLTFLVQVSGNDHWFIRHKAHTVCRGSHLAFNCSKGQVVPRLKLLTRARLLFFPILGKFLWCVFRVCEGKTWQKERNVYLFLSRVKAVFKRWKYRGKKCWTRVAWSQNEQISSRVIAASVHGRVGQRLINEKRKQVVQRFSLKSDLRLISNYPKISLQLIWPGNLIQIFCTFFCKLVYTAL